MANDRKNEICKDIAGLNQLINLRKIEIECRNDFDFSPMIIKGLCKEKKWIDKYKDNIHTFVNIFTILI